MSSALLALYAAVRGVIYVAILLLVGTQVVGLILRRNVPHDATGAGRDVRTRLARIASPVALTLLVAIIVRGVLQVGTFLDPGESATPELIRSVLLDGPWAHAWILQLAATIVLVGALRFRRGTGITPDPVIGIIVAVVIWGQTGMGHAGGDTWGWDVGRIVDAAHLLGAGIWLGTLGTIFLAVVPVLGGEVHLSSLATIVRSFSIYARTGATLVVISGLTAAAVYSKLSPSALIHSTWGRLLLVKLTALLGVVALGWYNWKVVTPALEGRTDTAPHRLRTAIRIELSLGLIMLAITTMLVVSALPGE